MAIILGPSYGEAGPIAVVLMMAVGLQLSNTSAVILTSARGKRGTMAPTLAIGISQALISAGMIALITALALRKMVFICHLSLPWRSFACTAAVMELAIGQEWD
ncbi:MAG: hypothetical protein KGQ93_02130 [Cyanobacteria bacterium REEB459]|nr:hypothetical protein [Cyanobacteria bacterium REEB459]